MIKDFKIFESYEEWINAPFKENFSFEKTETEKTINIEDYKEIYENIYKDRWLCRKGVGVNSGSAGKTFNIKELFGFGTWGILYNGKFKVVYGFDSDVEQIKLKKANYLIIKPCSGEKGRLENTDLNNEREAAYYRIRMNAIKRMEMTIKLSGTLELYNINDLTNDLQEFIGGNVIITGRIDNSSSLYNTPLTGQEISIKSPIYMGMNGKLRVITKEKYYDLNVFEPITCKRIHWTDSVIDPYGEEEWFDFDDVNEAKYTIRDMGILRYIKNFSIKDFVNDDDLASYLMVNYLTNYEMYCNSENPHYLNTESFPPEKNPSFSKYKSYLNNKFMKRKLFYVIRRNNNSFIKMSTVNGLSIDKRGVITRVKDEYGNYDDVDVWYGFFRVDTYIEALEYLIGKKINFTTWVKGKSPDKRQNKMNDKYIEGMKLKRVYLNKTGEIYFVDYNDKHYIANVFKDIELYKKRVFSLEDPYGEEDWN